MATQVGEAIIKLTFDDKESSSKISNFGSKAGNIAKNITKSFTVAFAGAAAAVTAFAKKSVDAFNEAEKAQAKLAQSAKNQNWAQGAVEDLKAYNSELQNLGIIEDDIYASGQAQLGTFGLSAEAVKTLTPAMGDLIAATSGYNATTESATQMANLMGKVMTGNVGALTRYGVTLDENQKKLLQNGNEMQRAAVLAEVLEQNYGDFNKALSKTPQGQVKQLSNSFGDLKESFGAFIAGEGDLDSFFNQLSIVINQAVNLITTMAPQIMDGIVKLITEIGNQLPSIIQSLLPIIMNSLIQLLMAWYELQPMIVNMLVESIPIIMNGLMQLLNALIAAIPTIIPKLVAAITNLITTIALQLTRPDFLTLILQSAITLLLEIVKALPTILTALIGALPEIITNIVNFLLDPNNLAMIINGAVQLFMGLVMAVPQILGALLGAFGSLVGSLWDWITSRFGQFAADFGNFVGDIFKGAINGMISFIENFINIPIDLLNGFLDVINGAFGWLGVNIGHIDRIQIPRLAQGGIATSATIAMIGEEGQEAVLPLEKNTDNWAGLLASTLALEMEEQGANGREINVYMTNQINNRLDAQEIGRVMMESIRRAA